ncbi:MAG: polyprenyl synthetase family protein [Planctomycetota bacterium]
MSQIVDRNGKPGLDAEASVAPVSLNAIYLPVAGSLKQVESILLDELSGDTPWVDELLAHSRIVGGKRMRPVFLLLCGACCGTLGDQHLQMAAALEMIHTASLIHDDVLDNAQTRRHGPTANSKWDNRISVLLGDYLFTHSFHVASRTGSPEALRMLAESSNRVCAGEMRQNAHVGNFEITEEQYLEIVSDKTAELVAGGCGLGALLSDADQETVDSFESFGRDLGIAFQIIDDVLDLVGTSDKVGKTLGTDIANHKPTLPVIHALASMEGVQRDGLLSLLTTDNPQIEQIVSILNEAGSIEYAREIARKHAERAIAFADGLESNEYSRALRTAARFVLGRGH